MAVGDQTNATKGSPMGPPRFRSPVPLSMRGQTEAVTLLINVDADRCISDALVLPFMTLVPDLPSAVGAT
jgi:hypothetical protein